MNYWKACGDLYNRLYGNDQLNINYEEAAEAILSDFRMVDLTRPFINNEQEFIEFAYNVFPLDSEAFFFARRFIGLKYLKLQKNEFIACYRRNEPGRVLYMPRAEVEYEPRFVQIVATAIPVMIVNGSPFFLFVKEDTSDMKGHTTMIGGHVQYGVNNDSSFDTICIDTARREAMEELGLDVLPKNPDMLKYRTDCPMCKMEESILGGLIFDDTSSEPLTSISHYHRGRSYSFDLNPDYVKHITMETGKTMVVWSPTGETEINVKDCNNRNLVVVRDLVNPDTWLQKFMNSII